MSRRLHFHRAFGGHTGGHGKVFDYFRHAMAHPRWEASVYFSEGAAHPENPWAKAGLPLQDSWQPSTADALFLAGMDWRQWPEDRRERPVINLVQHVRHAEPGADVYPFLSRPAVRLCVASAVADAILATGRVRGPVQVIEAAIDLEDVPRPPTRSTDLVVAALKQHTLGRRLAADWASEGWTVRLLDAPMPRREYLAAVADARIAVCLPNPTEGFYLPALEAMALGCAVVVPDCVGNRTYLEPDRNALVPAAEAGAIRDAVARLRDPLRRGELAEAGVATAGRFGQARERAAFHRVLDALPSLWHEAWR